MDTSTQPVRDLSLQRICENIKKLSTNQLDALAYINKGDNELCEITGLTKINLENYLGTIYRHLGIIHPGMTSADKRRAADIMYRVFDENGYRPNTEDMEFLRRAKDPDPEKGSKAQGAQTLPKAEELVPLIDELAPGTWKSDLFNALVRGETKEDMLATLQKRDPNADLSTVERGLHQLYRHFHIPNSYDHDNERIHNLLMDTYALWKGEAPSDHPKDTDTRAPASPSVEESKPAESPATTLSNEDVAETVDAPDSVELSAAASPLPNAASREKAPIEEIQDSVTTPVSIRESVIDYEAIVKRIRIAIVSKKIPSTQIRLLDAQSAYGANISTAALAVACSLSGKSVDIYLSQLRKAFQIPGGTAKAKRDRTDEECLILMTAWNMYRKKVYPDENPASLPEATHEPAPLLALVTEPQEVVSEPDIAKAPTLPEVSVALSNPEPAVEAPPIESEAKIDSPEIAEGEEDVSEPEVPESVHIESVPEQALEEPTPALSDSIPVAHTNTVSSPDTMLRDPKSITGVKFLWSNSPTFDADQTELLGLDYHIEQISHVVSFSPVIQTVSVLTFVKRG